MKSKNQLLKKLGFSSQFIEEIEKTSFDNKIDSSNQALSYCSSNDYLEFDLTSLTIENASESIFFQGIYRDK